MKVLSKVLWAVDFNEDHSKSLDKVVGSARLFGSEIILLHVLPGEMEGSPYRKIVEKSVRMEMDQLTVVLNKTGAFKIESRLVYGNVVERILDVAEEEDVNVIYVNRGKGAEESGEMLGLNAQKIVRMSRKPVAVASNLPSVETPHIVCPVDFSEPSTLALNTAILHARKNRARLTVISVFEPLRITSSRLRKSGLEEISENEVHLGNYKTELENYLGNFDFSGVDVEHKVLIGNPYQEIIRYSQLASVLFIGSTGKTGLRRAILGSVTEKVIREVESNMVVVKSEELFKLRIPTDLEDIEKHFERGTKLAEMGYVQEAISQYHQCLNINDLHLPSMWALAAVYERLGNTEKKKSYEELARMILKRMANRKIEEEIRRNLLTAS